MKPAMTKAGEPKTVDEHLEAWENVNWEGHGVNLERVQRIQLGIDNEAMDFSEESLASMLEKIAFACVIMTQINGHMQDKTVSCAQNRIIVTMAHRSKCLGAPNE